jgi:hypothetical protein
MGTADAYLRALETDENVVFKFVPRACTVAMMATEIPAAMRPYSIAVAPLSSLRKRKRHVMSTSVLTMSLYVVSSSDRLSD